MNRRSSSDRFRKSPASATDHPARSNRRRLSLRMAPILSRVRQAMVFGQTTAAFLDDGLWSPLRLLVENIQNHDRIAGAVIHDSSVQRRVYDGQFVTSEPTVEHRPR